MLMSCLFAGTVKHHYEDYNYDRSGLAIASDKVTNATNISSLATTSFGLVTKVATRFLYALDLNY